MSESVRKFETGATRDTDTTKPDFEGFLSPLVISRYAEYMHQNRVQRDGTFRDSDNWQRGIPLAAYMKSGWRHFFAWWGSHRDGSTPPSVLEHGLCGLLFNVSGYLHEYLKERGYRPALEWDKPFLEKEPDTSGVDSAATLPSGPYNLPYTVCGGCGSPQGHYSHCPYVERGGQ